jgi:hypothetical protein
LIAIPTAGAVSQFVAHGALDGDAISMNAGKLHPQQRIEWNLRQELANLSSSQLGTFHAW